MKNLEIMLLDAYKNFLEEYYGRGIKGFGPKQIRQIYRACKEYNTVPTCTNVLTLLKKGAFIYGFESKGSRYEILVLLCKQKFSKIAPRKLRLNYEEKRLLGQAEKLVEDIKN